MLQKIRPYRVTSRSPKTQCPHPEGFTLIELLVVLAIIALLVSIIVPSVNAARMRALQVRSQSDLRQIAGGILQYATDHDGKLPYGRYGSRLPERRVLIWADYVADYTGYGIFVNAARRMTRDPLNPGQQWEIGPYDPASGEVTDFQMWRRLPYGYNTTWMSPHYQPWYNRAVQLGRRPERKHTYVHDCLDPATVFLVADARIKASGWTCSLWYEHRTLGYGVYGYNSGKANMVFVDGHVKAMDADRVNGTGSYSGLDENQDGIDDYVAYWNPNPKSWTP